MNDLLIQCTANWQHTIYALVFASALLFIVSVLNLLVHRARRKKDASLKGLLSETRGRIESREDEVLSLLKAHAELLDDIAAKEKLIAGLEQQVAAYREQQISNQRHKGLAR